jgi:hypothetical protein
LPCHCREHVADLFNSLPSYRTADYAAFATMDTAARNQFVGSFGNPARIMPFDHRDRGVVKDCDKLDRQAGA